jgi:hypothetical protein
MQFDDVEKKEQFALSIRKNGEDIIKTVVVTTAGESDPPMDISTVSYSNGTTDYFEMIVWHDAPSGSQSIFGTKSTTNFGGFLISGGPGLTGATGPQGDRGTTTLRSPTDPIYITSSTQDLDCSVSDVFHCSLDSNSTVRLTGASNGQRIYVIMQCSNINHALTWSADNIVGSSASGVIRWQNGFPPSLTGEVGSVTMYEFLVVPLGGAAYTFLGWGSNKWDMS